MKRKQTIQEKLFCFKGLLDPRLREDDNLEHCLHRTQVLLASSLLIQVAYGMDNQVETEGEDFIQNKITQNKNSKDTTVHHVHRIPILRVVLATTLPVLFLGLFMKSRGYTSMLRL